MQHHSRFSSVLPQKQAMLCAIVAAEREWMEREQILLFLTSGMQSWTTGSYYINTNVP